MQIKADNPSNEDLLGYDPYVTAISDIVASADLETPFTIGIYGPWGTGKSTFMHLVARCLYDTYNYDTVLFEPWQFDQKEEVWKALLYTVLQHLQNILDKQGSRAEEQRKVLEGLFLGVSRLVLEKTINYFAGEKVDVDKILGAAAKTDRQNTQFVNTFRASFVKAKNQILDLDPRRNASNRLIVFVDDLDRCTPDNCLMVLEAIKLFFDLKECVFILGIDRDIIQKGVQRKYKESLAIRGQDYLEKIVQLPFTLPPVSTDTFRTYVDKSMAGLGFNDTTLRLIENVSEQNPRRVKRLGNCLALVKNVADVILKSGAATKVSSFDESRLAVLLMVQVRYPSVYAWLCREHMTFRALTGQDVDPNQTQAAATRVRQSLVDWLKIVDGQDDAEPTADSFLRFMSFAFRTLGVKDFADTAEVEAYLRITSVVREQPVTAGAPLHDRLDVALEGAAEEPPPPPMAQPSTPPEISDGEALLLQVRNTVQEWRTIQRRGFIGVVARRMFSMQQQFDEIMDRAQSLLAEFQRHELQFDGKIAQQIRFELDTFRPIPRDYVARQLSSAARSLILLSILGLLIVPYVTQVALLNLERVAALSAAAPAAFPRPAYTEAPTKSSAAAPVAPSPPSPATQPASTKTTTVESSALGVYIRTLFLGEAFWPVYVTVVLFGTLLITGVTRLLEASSYLRIYRGANPPAGS